MTDFIVIGGGISGSSIAFFLNKQTKSVKLIDKSGIASSGSKAAGAFLSPMIGVDNPYKTFVNQALKFSLNFYNSFAPELLIQSGVQRIPKDDEDIKNFETYEQFLDGLEYSKPSVYGGGFLFPMGAVINPVEIITKLTQGVEIVHEDIKTISYDGEFWYANGHKSKQLILADGAYNSLVNEEYIKIKKLWGQRIVVSTSTQIPYNLHKNCSISKTKDGLVSIGATYERGVLDQEPNELNTKKLLHKAAEIVKLEDIKVVDTIAGTRAATDDYWPYVGEIIDSQSSQLKYPNLKNGQKIAWDELIKYENLFIINGLGSRAFVLAPWIANNLANHILNNEEIFEETKTLRVFNRWVRKQR